MNAIEYLNTPAGQAYLQGVSALPYLGIIRAEGADAASFLHGQLSNDFSLLDARHARLAAYCTAQGRMLGSFIGFKRSPSEILLICHRELLPTTLKRLSQFVMRAKVRLSDATDQFLIRGIAGDATQGQLPPPKPWDLLQDGGGEVDGGAVRIQLYPALSVARQLWIAPVGSPEPAGPALDPDVWKWSEVHGGVATLQAGATEHYVPQMLNYESVGGVNFKKGCYPGQEVVARSQFRGTLKRRAFILHADAEMGIGDEIFSSADPEQPVGSVVQTARVPDNVNVAYGAGFDAIACLQLNALQSSAPQPHADQTSASGATSLHLGSADGPQVRFFALPYDLLQDI